MEHQVSLNAQLNISNSHQKGILTFSPPSGPDLAQEAMAGGDHLEVSGGALGSPLFACERLNWNALTRFI